MPQISDEDKVEFDRLIARRDERRRLRAQGIRDVPIDGLTKPMVFGVIYVAAVAITYGVFIHFYGFRANLVGVAAYTIIGFLTMVVGYFCILKDDSPAGSDMGRFGFFGLLCLLTCGLMAVQVFRPFGLQKMDTVLPVIQPYERPKVVRVDAKTIAVKAPDVGSPKWHIFVDKGTTKSASTAEGPVPGGWDTISVPEGAGGVVWYTDNNGQTSYTESF